MKNNVFNRLTSTALSIVTVLSMYTCRAKDLNAEQTLSDGVTNYAVVETKDIEKSSILKRLLGAVCSIPVLGTAIWYFTHETQPSQNSDAKTEEARRKQEAEEARRKQEAEEARRKQEAEEARRKQEAEETEEWEEIEEAEEKSETVTATESGGQTKKKSLSVSPVVTVTCSALSYVTNAFYYVAEKPAGDLMSLIGGTNADEGNNKKFNIGNIGKIWMKGIENNTYFHEMLIPGSHDSGTYSMRSSLAATQTLNIYQQLSYGVRCLDFRIRSWNGYPCIYHGPFAGEYMSNILNDINKFITENPSEIIFIKMETGSSSKCSENGLNLTLELPEMQALKNRCLTKRDMLRLGKYNLSELTMGDMRRLRRNIIIISDHKSEFFHVSKNLISKFDSESRSAGTEVMVSKTLEMLNEPTRRNKLNSISPIHTANATKILMLKGDPLQQEQYYSEARNRMLANSRDFNKKANIVSLDDIERNAEFIQYLISLNCDRHLVQYFTKSPRVGS